MYLFQSRNIFRKQAELQLFLEYMFMTCWLFLPVSFLKSDGGNPAFSYFTTLLTVCAVTAMIWLDLCQVGKFWVETCSLLFMKAWISLSHAHSSSMGGRFFCDSLEKKSEALPWNLLSLTDKILGVKGKEKQNCRDPGGRLSLSTSEGLLSHGCSTCGNMLPFPLCFLFKSFPRR